MDKQAEKIAEGLDNTQTETVDSQREADIAQEEEAAVQADIPEEAAVQDEQSDFVEELKAEPEEDEAAAQETADLPVQEESKAAEKKPLKTKRGLLKLILLSIITLGIYGIYFVYSVKRDINIICGDHNSPKTMGLIKLFLLSIVTLGIASIVWFHKLSGRIGRELNIRKAPYYFNSATYWLWGVLGCLIFIGPLVYLYKLCKAMNILCKDYNENG